MTKRVIDKQEKTLLVAMLLSAWAPVVTLIGVLIGGSLTQIGDFIRRSVEFLALVLAYLTYRKIMIETPDPKSRQLMEKRVRYLVSLTLFVSASVLVVFGVRGLLNEQYEEKNIIMGLVVAILGMLVNGWFYVRYRALERQHKDAIAKTQKRLYQAKTMVDMVVVTTYLLMIMSSDLSFIRMIDGSGMILVGLYMILIGIINLRHPIVGIKEPRTDD